MYPRRGCASLSHHPVSSVVAPTYGKGWGRGGAPCRAAPNCNGLIIGVYKKINQKQCSIIASFGNTNLGNRGLIHGSILTRAHQPSSSISMWTHEGMREYIAQRRVVTAELVRTKALHGRLGKEEHGG